MEEDTRDQTGWAAKLNKASGFRECKSTACCKNSPQVSNFVFVCTTYSPPVVSQPFLNFLLIM